LYVGGKSILGYSVTFDYTEIREHIVQFFERPFTEQFSWWPKLDDLLFDSIDEEGATWLERPFEESEALEAVKAMNRDKALGPDGFTIAFFQACWDVLKEDIMSVFMSFMPKSSLKKVLMSLSLLSFRKKSKVGDVQYFHL